MGSTLSPSILVWDSQDRINALCAPQCIENPILKGYVFNLKMGNSFLESNTSQTKNKVSMHPTAHTPSKVMLVPGDKVNALRVVLHKFSMVCEPHSASKHFSWDSKVHRNISAGPQSASKNFTWDLKVHRKNFNSPKVHPEFQCIPKSISNQPWKSPRNLEKNRKKQSRVENLWFSKCYFDLFCLYYFLLLLMYHFFGQFLGVKG